jgi:intraflagellar transport protein 140
VRGAIEAYEASGTHRHEVPRMLYDVKQTRGLEEYILASNDKKLLRWWAQYCESHQMYDAAVKYYGMAEETQALVRVHCFRDEVDKAAALCEQSNDMGANYHLARQYEGMGRVREAVTFYTRAKRFNHGVRLAKEHGLDSQLMTLALSARNKKLKVDAARYFEGKKKYDKAVLLYQKGGKSERALDLAFSAKLFDSLRVIAE